MSVDLATTAEIRREISRVQHLAHGSTRLNAEQIHIVNASLSRLAHWAKDEDTVSRETVQQLAVEWAEFIDKMLPRLDHNQEVFGRAIRRLRAVCARSGKLPDSFSLPEDFVEMEPIPAIDDPEANQVHRAHSRHSEQVFAVKTLLVEYVEQASERIIQDFRKETVTWKALKHDNVVPFYGILGGPKLRIFEGIPREYTIRIVSKWMPHGPIAQFLAAHPEDNRFKYYKDVVAGLHYLHGLGIVHGDIKNDNILVDATPTRVARICDFGISFSLNATGGATSDSRGRGSYPYLAPEMVDSVEPGTPEADIYAFAITIWETYTNDTPYRTLCQKRRARWYAMATYVKQGLRPTLPVGVHVPSRLWDAVQKSWSADPAQRCTLGELNDIFDELDPESSYVRNAKVSASISAMLANLQKLDLRDGSHDSTISVLLRGLAVHLKAGLDPKLAQEWIDWLTCDALPMFKRNSSLYAQGLRRLRSLCRLVSYMPTYCRLDSVELVVDAGPVSRTNSSVVFKGRLGLTRSAIVAVKCCVVPVPEVEQVEKIAYTEAIVWHAVEHRHIVPFIGILRNWQEGWSQLPLPGTTVTHPVCLVSLWMENGSVTQYLTAHAKCSLEDRMGFIRNIYSGLSFLHSIEVVHGDLKGANVLLDAHLVAKLMDFGITAMAKNTSTLTAFTRNIGSEQWAAPELTYDPHFGIDLTRATMESDVFGFAMVLWHILTGEIPYSNSRSPGVMIMQGVKPGPRPAVIEAAEFDELWELVARSWTATVSQRPALSSYELLLS